MMQEFHFRIADFVWRLRLPVGCDVNALLPSFRAFRTEKTGGEPLLLTCDVEPLNGATAAAIDGRLLDESVNDMGLVRLYDRRGGYVVTLSARPDGVMHRMTANRDFSEVRIALRFDDRDAGFILASLIRIAYSQAILYHEALSIHASAVFHEGVAYLFMGRSGTGKSTHSSLWIRHLPGTELLNDDNPTVRLRDGRAWAYGTPWSGKTPCYRPLAFPIGGMVRLSQAPENRFRRQEGANAFVALYPGCSVICQDSDLLSRLYDTLIRLAESVPVGLLACRPDAEAARLCYESLHGIR